MVQPAKGREKVGFVTRRVAGHLYVTPVDTLALLREGRLDQRLFDVTGLLRSGYDDNRADLPLIITHPAGTAASTARAAVSAAGTTVVRDLPAVHGYAVRQPHNRPAALWNAVTATATAPSTRAGAAPRRTMRAGISTIWLDAMRKPSLDVSVPMIGAPQAWQAGLTGAGIEVGVVDTGVDGTHPDLAGRVAASRNFTDEPTDIDDVGHGTHVASTIAGNGAASTGRYTGVAPEAAVSSAKVCVIEGCLESWILDGMQWEAAERHVRVVNMSLGGEDTPDIDPLEQAVENLTAQYGTLFVVAAGNEGADGTVGSPASADAALAVGAVTKAGDLADFSSRGPRVGDHAIKPDITAPGVNIVAARGRDARIGTPTGPDGRYMSLSGTSMATPHVAGSAALLVQEHPDWTPQQVKATLMAAAKPDTAIGVFGQGAGRVDVGRAIRQNVTATPASVSFGQTSWPHDDDVPVAKVVTYHNAGTAPVTLDLTMDTKSPDGTPTPAGEFTVSPATVTVAPGGDAPVTVTVDTRLAGPDGLLGGALTATGTGPAAGTVAVVPVAVDREVESYDLTVSNMDRTGALTPDYSTVVGRVDRRDDRIVYGADGTATVRLPKGRYVVSTLFYAGSKGASELTLLTAPSVTLDRDQALTMDARIGRPVTVTVPRADATNATMSVGFGYVVDGVHDGVTLVYLPDTASVYTGQVGARIPVAGFSSNVSGQWGAAGPDGDGTNSPYQYLLSWSESGTMFDGFTRTVADQDLARVITRMATGATGAVGLLFSASRFPAMESGGWAMGFPYTLPGTTTRYLNTDDGQQWLTQFNEDVAASDPQNPSRERVSETDGGWITYRAGHEYHEVFNQAVFGPTLSSGPFPWPALARTGDTMMVNASLFGDAAGRPGIRSLDTAGTTVDVDGVRVGESTDPGGEFTVPAGQGRYTVTVHGESAAMFTLSTAVSTTWTFNSGHVDGSDPVPLPVSVVRFSPSLDLDNAAPHGAFRIPFAVMTQAGSAAAPARTVRVQVSFDDGGTWRTAEMDEDDGGFVAQTDRPGGTGFVSLRAAETDLSGNTVEQTIIRAYRY